MLRGIQYATAVLVILATSLAVIGDAIGRLECDDDAMVPFILALILFELMCQGDKAKSQ